MSVFSVISFCLIVVILLTLLSQPHPRNDWRIAQVERKIDALLQRFEIDYMDVSFEAVRSYLVRGQKTQAIGIFRKLNPSASLKDAVSAVEAVERDLLLRQ